MENDTVTNYSYKSEQFREYAERNARQEVYMPPYLLSDYERRTYIRKTIIEDHLHRISSNPAGTEKKFKKIYKSVFYFFRGTAMLYYRDYAGTDMEFPIVFTNGDIHPENFGIMPNKDGVPFFGVNDFDEVCFAPFTYDVRRGAIGFNIGALINEFKKRKRKKIVKKFVTGYLNGLKKFALNDQEKTLEYRHHNSPPVVCDILDNVDSRAKFLKKLIDLKKEKFIPSKKVVPYSRLTGKFQKIIDKYRKDSDIERGKNERGFFKVKDVAIKKGSGTASLGLDRYYVLLNGSSDDPLDNIVLEIKQARRSAVYSVIPKEVQSDNDNQADQIMKAHSVHLASGDPFYGKAVVDKQDFLVRERSPFKNEVDLEDLDYQEFKEYADICGQVLALTHSRSDQDSGMEVENMEETILSSISETIFIQDMIDFSQTATKRIKRDHQLFCEDYDKGAYILDELQKQEC